MDAPDDSTRSSSPARDYRILPPQVRLEETVATVDADPVPDPSGGRNTSQHEALRDD